MKKNSTLKIFLLFFSISFSNLISSQANQWTWIKGDSTVFTSAKYGIKGVASLTNNPPPLWGSMNLKDKVGNFWLFGGTTYGNASSIGLLNQMWKYTISSSSWTWINGDSTSDKKGIYGTQGIPMSTNAPGGRYGSGTWTDNNGNFWLFGGYGLDSRNYLESLNDLWKYDTLTNAWTWVKGESRGNKPGVYGTKGISSPQNTPGSRNNFVSWTDLLGNFWLFGGYGYGYSSNTIGRLNDMWKYSPITNEWVWISGDGSALNNRVYGIKGIPDSNNNPGGRVGSANWTDLVGNLWLFGGNSGLYNNDLWKYNITTNEWTWVKGDSILNFPGAYGTQGTPSQSAKPGARIDGINWTDASGNLWLFGGNGFGSSTTGQGIGLLNDLWKYSPTTNEWTWVKGQITVENTALYGTKGIPMSSNNPGSRQEPSGWTDEVGDLWLYGGRGYAKNFNQGLLNDLWIYTVGNSLPVTLLSFTGTFQGENINLQWKVENEVAFDRYIIERSFNAKEFSKIGEVTGSSDKNYVYNDNVEKLREKKVYYRLKLLDKDGRFTYSSIVLIQISLDTNFTISPNPASSTFKLQLDKNSPGKVNIEIADLTGKVLMTKAYDVNGPTISISVNELVAGTYFVKMIYKDKQYQQKLIVVK